MQNRLLNIFPENKHNKVWEVISEIQSSLFLNHNQIAELLGFTGNHFCRLKAKRGPLPADRCLEFVKRLGIPYSALFNGSIDYRVLTRNYFNDEPELPHKYKVGAFGKRRTVINIIEYVAGIRGREYKKALLNHFQMRDDLFLDPNQNINNRFIVDLCDYLVKRGGFTEKDLFEMGKYSFTTNKNNHLGQALSLSPTPSAVYEQVIEDKKILHYDSNFHYIIQKMKKDFCIINIKDNEEVTNILKTKKLGSYYLSVAKAGVFASMPVYAGFDPSVVKILKCSHRGDSHCQIEITFNHQAIKQLALH